MAMIKGSKMTEEQKKNCGHLHTEESKKKLGLINKRRYASGEKFGFQKGNTVWLGKKLSIETRRKISEGRLGDKNWMWKGGATDKNKKIRMGIDFRLWREAVFARDNYTCQMCGVRGGELHPDHIKQFAYHPELRFDITNGRTLCKKCHRLTPSWGQRKHICCDL